MQSLEDGPRGLNQALPFCHADHRGGAGHLQATLNLVVDAGSLEAPETSGIWSGTHAGLIVRPRFLKGLIR